MSAKFLFLESMEILGTIPQYQTLLVVFISFWVVWMLAKRRYREPLSRRLLELTEEETERKLAEWHPEPLIPVVPENHPFLKPRKVTSRIGKRIVVNGINCLNLGTHNYLGFLERKEIESIAAKTVCKYGVGSCGPRGFYGTVDVHLELEERLAEFMETEEAVVYSYGFSTIASAIPAYCKRRDIVFVDERVNFSIQKGLDASRSNILYFKHNDTQDLERLLEKQAETDKRDPKKASKIRRFLVVEGIYVNTGLICPLPQLVSLCERYKLRIFVDESISFGTIGQTGKGVTEYFGISRDRVDVIMGSLEYAMGSVGGFCVGSSFVMEHQRLSGLGYCFSASLPPLLTSAAITALEIIKTEPALFGTLKDNCLAVDAGLKKIDLFEVSGIPESPIKHLYLREKLDRSLEQNILDKISNKAMEKNLAIIPAAYLDAERILPRPSLRVCVSVVLTNEDIDFALETLENCARTVLVHI